jgi:predicted O-methyltransferase YrrM
MTVMPIDPFELKSLPKVHPRRALYTAWARSQDWWARRRFRRYAFPFRPPVGADAAPAPPVGDTWVTPEQYRCLWAALRATDHLTDTRVVEVGAYRGVTTAYLARNCGRPVVAVDPYSGHSGTEADLAVFRANTAGLPQVTHVRATSGRARTTWPHGRAISVVFIDAVTDYANRRFDIASWRPLVVSGGIIVLPDVDNPRGAGLRRAAFELLRVCPLFVHVENMAAFRVP